MIRRPSGWGRRLPSKPRASGDDPSFTLPDLRGRTVNPARAGMIPDAVETDPFHYRKPRASGDDPGP